MDGKISDEIRQLRDVCCADCVDKDCCDEMRALADRIDHELVELPLSADGKIWTGREVCFWVKARGGALELHSLRSLDLIDGSRWYVRDTGGLGYEAGAAWHERPDTFERIADELEAWCDHVDVDGDACDKPRDLAERIRKLVKEQTNE